MNKITDIEFRKTNGDGVYTLKSWIVDIRFSSGDRLPMYFTSEMKPDDVVVLFADLLKELVMRFLQ